MNHHNLIGKLLRHVSLPKAVSIYLVGMVLPLLLPAQGSVKEQLVEARRHFDHQEYQPAIDLCSALLFKDDKLTEAYVIRGSSRVNSGEWRDGMIDLDYAIQRKTGDPMAYYYMGAIFQARGETDKAVAYFRTAVKIDPKSINARFFLGQMLAIEEQWVEAIEQLNTAMAMDPQSGDAYFYKGQYHYLRREFTTAVINLEKGLELNTTRHGDAENMLGAVCLELGDTATAMQHFLRATEDRRASINGWLSMAGVLSTEGDYDSALVMVEQALLIDSVNPRALLARGECLFNLERYEASIEVLDSAIALAGIAKYHSYYWRGKSKHELKRYREAIADFTICIGLNPESYWAFLSRGKSRFELDQFDKALEDFHKAHTINAQAVGAWHWMGVVYIETGEFAKAEEIYREFSQAFPSEGYGWFNLGQATRPQGKYKEAAESYTMALATFYHDSLATYLHRSSCFIALEQLDRGNSDINAALKIMNPKNPRELSDVSWNLNLAGRYQEALQLLEKSIAMDTTIAYAFNNRGYARLRLGQYEAAISDFDKSIALKNDFEHLPVYNRAHALRALGRYREAIADFDLAISHKADYYEALNDRGETWEMLNESEKAIADFRAALAINPNYRLARLNLQRIGQ